MKYLRDGLILTLLIYIVLVAFALVSIHFSSLVSLRPVVTAVLFLYVPLLWARMRRYPVELFGFNFSDLPGQLKDFMVVVLWVFPVFAGGFLFYHRVILGFHYTWAIPHQPLQKVLFHLFGAALPEELYFRGFLQQLCNEDLRRRWHSFGASWGPGVFVSALLFAMGHLVFDPRPERLAVFVPGVLFGVLRERHDSIALPVLLHWSANVMVDWLSEGILLF